MNAMCKWTQDNEDYSGKWDTDCGQSFWFDIDGPDDHGMHYCCFCGKSLMAVPYMEEDDE